jgi:type I restriction-modification system DNA methylase subunit
MSKEQAKSIIESLVERFREHKDEYHASDYNEQKTRQDFINPFFKALGWDIDNEKGDSEAYREVIYEDKVVVREGRKDRAKAPDYGFRLSGSTTKRLFYVEAKKPSVSLKANKEAAYQLRRYGSSAQAHVSILTNFEDFIVYDCSKVPNLNDSASVARLKYIGFEDYEKEFDFIYDTFSHEAVTKGRFDKFVQGSASKRGTDTLDKRFVRSLDEWRQYLAKNIAWNNRKINDEELNFAVQQTIDRLIFLRFCEDRAVEPYGQLQKAVSKGDSYKNLFDLFKQADDKYNSGLFDFEKDTITPKLKVDNKVLKIIISELYYPVCNYEFSVMPVEILGNAYEQFLGKVIRITPARGVKIEEKPEVRKAGGVFYTPQYIVEYIVKNTVGKLIAGKSPKEIEKITIVDPACGSGSFLVGAFEFLLNYHINWYHENGSKKGKDNPFTPQGTLSTHEKKRILLNNIYGVDIDANAVEVTKLSLLLKCLEGETEASIRQQISLFHERVLPDLDNNIKSGNSLIGTDYYESEIDLGYQKKIKPFSWKKGFPEIFRNGGFSAVIGNPPYVRQELITSFKNYFETHYRVFHATADLYNYFIEKGKTLLKQEGFFGIIVANKWMRANYGTPLRKWLKQIEIIEIIDFGDLPVFHGATTYPCILIYKNASPESEFNAASIKTLQFSSLEKVVTATKIRVSQETLADEGWNLSAKLEQDLIIKIKKNSITLSKYVNDKIYYGLKTGLNEAFVIDRETKERLIKEDKKCSIVIKPFLAGRDIERYQVPHGSKYLIFLPKGWTNKKGKHPKNPWRFLQETYPSIANHLTPFENAGKKRTDMGDYWWELRACDYYAEFEKPKIVYQVFQVSPCFIWDEAGHFCNNATWIIPKDDKYLLAILNSPLGWYLIGQYCTQIQNGYQLIYKYLEKVPIRKIDFEKSTETKAYSQIISNVDLILKLNEKLKSSKLQDVLESLKQRIEHCEENINQLIYELYDLSEAEIRVIEGGIHE